MSRLLATARKFFPGPEDVSGVESLALNGLLLLAYASAVALLGFGSYSCLGYLTDRLVQLANG